MRERISVLLGISAPILGFTVCRLNDQHFSAIPLLIGCLSVLSIQGFQQNISNTVKQMSRCSLIFVAVLVLNPLDLNSPIVSLCDNQNYTNFLMRKFFSFPSHHPLKGLPSGGPVRTVTNISDFASLWEIVKASPKESILFKGVLNTTTLSKLTKFFLSQKKVLGYPGTVQIMISPIAPE